MSAAGHRTAVTELSGRTVNYSYDNLYRLTSEMLSGWIGAVRRFAMEQNLAPFADECDKGCAAGGWAFYCPMNSAR